MNKWLCANLPKDNTVVILDWRIAKQLTKTFEKHKIPWILMDRSPPADSNILAKVAMALLEKRMEISTCMPKNRVRSF